MSVWDDVYVGYKKCMMMPFIDDDDDDDDDDSVDD